MPITKTFVCDICETSATGGDPPDGWDIQPPDTGEEHVHCSTTRCLDYRAALEDWQAQRREARRAAHQRAREALAEKVRARLEEWDAANPRPEIAAE